MRRNLGRRRRRNLGRTNAPKIVRQATGKHYVYQCVIGDWYYIGYSSRSPEIRWAEHIRYAKRGKAGKFYNILRKHNFKCSWSVLEAYNGQFEALKAELDAIGSIGADVCANSDPGGQGVTMKVNKKVLDSGESVYEIIGGCNAT